MRLFSTLAVAGLLVCSFAAKADELSYFTVQGTQTVIVDGADQVTGQDIDLLLSTNAITGTGTYNATTNALTFDTLSGVGIPYFPVGDALQLDDDTYQLGSPYDYINATVTFYGPNSPGFSDGTLTSENAIRGGVIDPGTGDFVDGRIIYRGEANLIAATPEPSSFALLGTGLLGVAGVMRRRWA